MRLIGAAIAAVLVLGACDTDIQSGIDSANDLLYQQKYVDAERLYRKLLKRLGDDVNNFDEDEEEQHRVILDRLGKLNALYLHDHEAAINYYQQLIRSHPRTDEAFTARATMADLYHHKVGDLQRAIDHYEKLVSEFPRRPEARQAQLKIASAYFQLRNYEQARAEAEKLINRWPASPESYRARFQVANSYYVQKRYAEAIATYEQLLKVSTEESEALDKSLVALVLFELGNCYQEIDEAAKALAYYYACLPDHPDPHLVQRKIKHVRSRARQVKPAAGIYIPGRPSAALMPGGVNLQNESSAQGANAVVKKQSSAPDIDLDQQPTKLKITPNNQSAADQPGDTAQSDLEMQQPTPNSAPRRKSKPAPPKKQEGAALQPDSEGTEEAPAPKPAKRKKGKKAPKRQKAPSPSAEESSVGSTEG